MLRILNYINYIILNYELYYRIFNIIQYINFNLYFLER